MQAQSTEENSNTTSTVTPQQKMNAQASCERCLSSRLFRVSPLIFVLVGSVLTVVGQTTPIKICNIVGPVSMTVGGLLLAFITIWSSRQGHAPPQREGTSPSCEENNAGFVGDTAPKESSYQLGPIHHVEVWIPPETVSPPEIVPPSYEEATGDDNTESLNEGNVHTNDLPTEPPSYDESHVLRQNVESQSSKNS